VKTTVINKHHGNVPADAIYIGRGSKWGNPFSHMTGTKATYLVSSREEAISRYRDWVTRKPELMAALHELRGRTLVCFCKPKGCHGDVLADLADAL
jgi:hypothetical protein